MNSELNVSADARSRRVAVVADALLDAKLDELGAAGYGIIQLPPTTLDAATRAAWFEQAAEHVAEFVRTGYEVVLVDDGGDAPALAAALAPLGVPPPPAYAAGSRMDS
jgi:hypothetical protein